MKCLILKTVLALNLDNGTLHYVDFKQCLSGRILLSRLTALSNFSSTNEENGLIFLAAKPECHILIQKLFVTHVMRTIT